MNIAFGEDAYKPLAVSSQDLFAKGRKLPYSACCKSCQEAKLRSWAGLHREGLGRTSIQQDHY